ncbi:MAG: hypothetical protein ICV53_19575 [Flavisolibacter sp.]|nr:hypothetical protein [Flavisolibacter sp.]MBD0368290.1 hypothetical protein [Flavisolibacter sp.]
MYSFFKTIGLKKFIITELPILCLALFIAEVAYKFGSFILECGAFLATWFFISWFFHSIQSIHFKREKP